MAQPAAQAAAMGLLALVLKAVPQLPPAAVTPALAQARVPPTGTHQAAYRRQHQQQHFRLVPGEALAAAAAAGAARTPRAAAA